MWKTESGRRHTATVLHRVSTRALAYRAAILAVLLLAFWLRVRTLGARALWFDEALEYWAARVEFPVLWLTVRQSLQDPPLWTLLLYFWSALGEQEFWLRYPSLVCSVLSVAGVSALGKRMAGPWVGLIAALLMATASPQIRYAQEVGQYAPMVLAVVAALLVLDQALRTNRRGWWLAWGAVIVLALYTYYGTIVPLAGLVLASGMQQIYRRTRDRWPGFLISTVAGGALTLPLVVFFLPVQLYRGPSESAFRVQWGPVLDELARFLAATQHVIQWQFTGYEMDRLGWAVLPVWVSWLPATLAMLWAAVCALKSAPGPRRIVGWAIIVWAVTYAGGKLNILPYLGRYSLVLSPLAFLLIGLGAWQAKKVHWSVGALLVAVTIVAGLFAIPERPEDVRSVAHFWQTERDQGDVTYVYYGATPAFGYYSGLERSLRVSPMPGDQWFRACFRGSELCQHLDGLYFGTWVRALAPADKRAAIRQTIGEWPARLWLIFGHVSPGEDQQIVDALVETGYVTVNGLSAQNASAVLLERK